MVRVLLADDHPVVRVGLAQILRGDQGIKIVGEASNYAELFEFLWRNDCDVILLDLSMPGGSGLEKIAEIKRIKPGVKILVVSMYPEEQYAVRSLRAGASGYLTKESVPEELINAIRKVHSGGRYISPKLAELLAAEVSGDRERYAHEYLSDREYQIMIMLASGKGIKEIAEELSLSIKTVSTYRARILQKMGFKSNAQLTIYAIKNGLIV